ncbi:MAG: peroxiredoxin [Candidatus Odinarchaeota archaeon]
MLATGSQAPEFTLKSTVNNVSLKDYRGNPVILVFYPADGTSVCSSQLALYNELLPVFEDYNAHLLAISSDSLESHVDFSKKLNLDFPLLSDEKAEVIRTFGVIDEKTKRAKRVLFVLDETGVIHWNYESPASINPGADGILKALESMKKRVINQES